MIGGLVILSVAYSFYQAAIYGLWRFYSIDLISQSIFCVIFLVTMISEAHDTYKMRMTVTIYYFVGIVLIPTVLTALALYGVGWDVIGKICVETLERDSKNQ